MSKAKKDAAEYRNIRLTMQTYERLDEYLFGLMKEKGNRRMSLDDAVSSLLDAHSKRS